MTRERSARLGDMHRIGEFPDLSLEQRVKAEVPFHMCVLPRLTLTTREEKL